MPHTYGAGSVGYGNNTGSVSSSSGSTSGTSIHGSSSGSNLGHLISASHTFTMKPIISQSPDLPSLSFITANENNEQVTMTLNPESGISPTDCMKLMMLITAMTMDSTSFNALAYVKKQNLERHFNYS